MLPYSRPWLTVVIQQTQMKARAGPVLQSLLPLFLDILAYQLEGLFFHFRTCFLNNLHVLV